MSRIGKQPIRIPTGVEVAVTERFVLVTGPRGVLRIDLHGAVDVGKQNGLVTCSPKQEDTASVAQTGTFRSLVANMVKGVSTGFEKELQLVGVGYRAQIEGKVLRLALGFSHSIEYRIADDVDVVAPTPTRIVVSGTDKQRVGQVAAEIRGYRPPEPYKGKGVRYAGEVLARKEAKKKQ